MSESYFTGNYDTLIGESSVRLFGRLMWDIQLKATTERNKAYESRPRRGAAGPPRLSENNFLIEQLRSDDARLARISGFSYQSEFFNLAKPAIFLVHGEGTTVEVTREGGIEGLYLRKAPAHTDRTGMVGQHGSYAPDISMWIYDRADFSIRLDTETGTFDQILLAFELGSSIDTGSMHGGAGDPPPPPPRRRHRRRWRGDDD